MLELNCPSCGGKVPFRSTISILAVCPFCRTQVLRDDMKLQDLGKVADFHQDGSVLQLGARGVYRGAAFAVIGRLQLRYPDGYWNEWFLSLSDGRHGWLGEAQGTYCVSFAVEPAPRVPEVTALTIGAKVTLGGSAYEVTDLHDASYITAEGELPFRVPLGRTVSLADLRGDGARFATFDYSDDAPAVYWGEYVPFPQLKFEGLKAVEGW